MKGLCIVATDVCVRTPAQFDLCLCQCRIPYQYFVCSGFGQTDSGGGVDPWETGSYDIALEEAGLASKHFKAVRTAGQLAVFCSPALAQADRQTESLCLQTSISSPTLRACQWKQWRSVAMRPTRYSTMVQSVKLL